MPRRKTDDAAGASHGLPSQQRIVRVPLLNTPPPLICCGVSPAGIISLMA